MWKIVRITGSQLTFAAIHNDRRAFVIGDTNSVIDLQATMLSFLTNGATTDETIDAQDDAFGVCWESTGQAMRRYGMAKSTARYRAANDPRCRKAGGSWECPREVWREYAE